MLYSAVRHIAGSVTDSVQYCARCGEVIEKDLMDGFLAAWVAGEGIIVLADGRGRCVDTGNWPEVDDCISKVN